jgi:hypothetical protein
MFDGYKTSSVLLLVFGTAVIVFGLLVPDGNFFTESLTRRGIVRKPMPTWFGRLWFVAAGALLVYWGLMHGRP